MVEADKRGLAAEVSEEMESVRRRLQEELSQALKERNVAKEDALKIYKVLGKGFDLNAHVDSNCLGMRCEMTVCRKVVKPLPEILYC